MNKIPISEPSQRQSLSPAGHPYLAHAGAIRRGLSLFINNCFSSVLEKLSLYLIWNPQSGNWDLKKKKKKKLKFPQSPLFYYIKLAT